MLVDFRQAHLQSSQTRSAILRHGGLQVRGAFRSADRALRKIPASRVSGWMPCGARIAGVTTPSAPDRYLEPWEHHDVLHLYPVLPRFFVLLEGFANSDSKRRTQESNLQRAVRLAPARGIMTKPSRFTGVLRAWRDRRTQSLPVMSKRLSASLKSILTRKTDQRGPDTSDHEMEIQEIPMDDRPHGSYHSRMWSDRTAVDDSTAGARSDSKANEDSPAAPAQKSSTTAPKCPEKRRYFEEDNENLPGGMGSHSTPPAVVPTALKKTAEEMDEGDSFYEDENSKWIHRDKLALVESAELQAAGTYLPRLRDRNRDNVRSKSQNRAKRDPGSDQGHGQPRAVRDAPTTNEEAMKEVKLDKGESTLPFVNEFLAPKANAASSESGAIPSGMSRKSSTKKQQEIMDWDAHVTFCTAEKSDSSQTSPPSGSSSPRKAHHRRSSQDPKSRGKSLEESQTGVS